MCRLDGMHAGKLLQLNTGRALVLWGMKDARRDVKGAERRGVISVRSRHAAEHTGPAGLQALDLDQRALEYEALRRELAERKAQAKLEERRHLEAQNKVMNDKLKLTTAACVTRLSAEDEAKRADPELWGDAERRRLERRRTTMASAAVTPTRLLRSSVPAAGHNTAQPMLSQTLLQSGAHVPHCAAIAPLCNEDKERSSRDEGHLESRTIVAAAVADAPSTALQVESQAPAAGAAASTPTTPLRRRRSNHAASPPPAREHVAGPIVSRGGSVITVVCYNQLLQAEANRQLAEQVRANTAALEKQRAEAAKLDRQRKHARAQAHRNTADAKATPGGGKIALDGHVTAVEGRAEARPSLAAADGAEPDPRIEMRASVSLQREGQHRKTAAALRFKQDQRARVEAAKQLEAQRSRKQSPARQTTVRSIQGESFSARGATPTNLALTLAQTVVSEKLNPESEDGIAVLL